MTFSFFIPLPSDISKIIPELSVSYSIRHPHHIRIPRMYNIRIRHRALPCAKIVRPFRAGKETIKRGIVFISQASSFFFSESPLFILSSYFDIPYLSYPLPHSNSLNKNRSVNRHSPIFTRNNIGSRGNIIQSQLIFTGMSVFENSHYSARNRDHTNIVCSKIIAAIYCNRSSLYINHDIVHGDRLFIASFDTSLNFQFGVES